MKIKDVNFPKALLNALRDGRLVVFAGAGVSMGLPAGLPNFRKLTERVAEGTGQSRTRKDCGKVVESVPWFHGFSSYDFRNHNVTWVEKRITWKAVA